MMSQDQKNKSGKFRILADCAILCVVGLAPALWFQEGSLLISEDLNVPKTFEILDRYFYAWDDSINLGVAPFDYFQAIFFFFFQTLISALDFSLQTTQKLLFIFWFAAPGLSFYYFLRAFLPTHILQNGALAGSLFYMTTTALIPIWQGFNIANLTGYTFGPILLTLFFLMMDGRLSYFKGAALFGLMSFLASPLGVNSPFLLVFSIPFMLYSFFKIIIPLKDKEYKSALIILAKASGFAFIFVLVNTFWIIPLFNAVFTTSPENISPFTHQSATEWLSGISQRTSILNVIRQQGIWTWTNGYGVGSAFDLYDAYSVKFLENPFFIIISFLFPIFVFFAAFIRPRIDKAGFFSVLALISIIGGAGAHLPTGALYLFLFKTVPFLWMVRSPWYKFSFLTTLSFGVLLTITLGYIASQVHKSGTKSGISKILLSNLQYIAIIFLLIYASPLLRGEMFPSTEVRKVLPTNHLKIPEYAWSSAEFMKKENLTGRVLSLPHFTHSHGNKWGFYGFKSIFYQISKINILEQSPPNLIINGLYKAFNKRDAEKFLKLAQLLGVNHILYEDDAINKIAPDAVFDHEENRKFLLSVNGIDVVKKFGKWTLYKIQPSDNSL
jgi:hypothetical protein